MTTEDMKALAESLVDEYLIEWAMNRKETKAYLANAENEQEFDRRVQLIAAWCVFITLQQLDSRLEHKTFAQWLDCPNLEQEAYTEAQDVANAWNAGIGHS